jgi:hypothetical protein
MADLESLIVSDALDRIIVPDARNFESVDAFRASSTPVFPSDSTGTSTDSLYCEAVLFQMTVGKSHPTKLKGVKKVVEKFKKCVPADAVVTCAVVQYMLSQLMFKLQIWRLKVFSRTTAQCGHSVIASLVIATSTGW